MLVFHSQGMKSSFDEKSGNRLWQKAKYANLVRNASSGKYFARFRSNGKVIWRGLDTSPHSPLPFFGHN
jgi:hypothetical protein